MVPPLFPLIARAILLRLAALPTWALFARHTSYSLYNYFYNYILLGKLKKELGLFDTIVKLTHPSPEKERFGTQKVTFTVNFWQKGAKYSFKK